MKYEPVTWAENGWSVTFITRTHFSPLFVGGQAGGTGQLGLLVEVGVGGLVGQAHAAVGRGLQVGVGPGSVASFNSFVINCWFSYTIGDMDIVWV